MKNMIWILMFGLLFCLGWSIVQGAEWQPPSNALKLQNKSMAIFFAGAEGGFACLGIKNLEVGKERFVQNSDGGAFGLWELQFAEPPKLGAPQLTGVLDTSRSIFLGSNGNGQRCRYQRIANGYRFFWKQLDLPGEAGVIDVICEVTLLSGKSYAEWNIEVRNRSRKYGLWEYSYPRLRQVFAPGSGDAMLPGGVWGGKLYKNSSSSCGSVIYPCGTMPMQFMAFNLGEAGFYYAAHDSNARTKIVQCSPDQNVSILTMASNMGQIGAGCKNEFPVAVGVYQGDWFQAAKIYRGWALQQKWTQKGPIAKRSDYPKKWHDFGFFLLVDGAPERVEAIMKDAQAKVAGRVPIGVHWYCWFKGGNTCVGTAPVFDPLPGVPKTTERLTGMGQLVMPYIDAYVWSQEDAQFPQVKSAAAKRENGSLYDENYDVKCATMCPYTEIWQNTVLELCRNLVNKNHANAIYLDELALQPPNPCFDPSHGHPLGGGSHWVDGYRKMLEKIRQLTVAKGIPILTEAPAEPYMDLVDGFLIWGERTSEDVPALTAVYSGYTIYFSSRIQPGDTMKSFLISTGRDFLYGAQLGWMYEFMLDNEHKEHLELLIHLTELRRAAKEFLIDGELMESLRPEKPTNTITLPLLYRTPHQFSVPRVQGTVWRSLSGELLCAIINYGDTPQTFAFEVPCAKLLGGGDNWTIERLTKNGKTKLRSINGLSIRFEELLPPGEVRLLVIHPEPSR